MVRFHVIKSNNGMQLFGGLVMILINITKISWFM